MVIVFSSSLIKLKQSLFPLILSLAWRFKGAQSDTSPFCQQTESLAKINALLFHDKRKNVTAGRTGAKAMPALLCRKDKKRSVFLTVEGAQAFEVTPRFLQRNMLRDKLHYIQSLLYLRDHAH